MVVTITIQDAKVQELVDSILKGTVNSRINISADDAKDNVKVLSTFFLGVSGGAIKAVEVSAATLAAAKSIPDATSFATVEVK